MNFQYTVDIESNEPIMLINKHIGFDSEYGMGIDGSSFQAELLRLDTMGKKRIQVWINSPGGVVTDGYSIYNAILKSNTPVDTYVVGIAASIAGVIFQAGRKRIMSDYGVLMYHNPFGGGDKALFAIRESIIKMIASRSGIDSKEVGNIMTRETFINAETALAMGFADSIESSDMSNNKYIRKTDDVFAFHRQCNTILNSINKFKKQDMLEIKNRLNLAEDATEEVVLNAINEIENKAKEDIKEEMDSLKKKMEETQSMYDSLKAEYDDMCKNKIELELQGKEVAAKNLIDEVVKAGKIRNEDSVKNHWISVATENFESAKTLLESIPMNKVATKVEVEPTVSDIPTSAAFLEAKLRNKLKLS